MMKLLSQSAKYILLAISFSALFLTGCGDDDAPTVVPEPVPFGEFIDDWTYRVNPEGFSNFNIAEFRLWLPEQTDIRAILILLNHNNGNALGLVNTSEWQEYAKAEGLALFGVKFVSTTSGHYTYASDGSGRALLGALDTLSAFHNISDIAKLPFLMRGYSAGGVFSFGFSSFMPDRVISFANIRGGSLDGALDKNNKIPALMLVGENDQQWRNQRITETVLGNRKLGGLWNLAIEPDVDHFGGLMKSDDFIRVFFSEILHARVEPNMESLVSLDESTGFLCNTETKACSPYDSYIGDKDEASWLMNETLVDAWQAHQ